MEPYLPNYLKGKNRRLVFDLLRERGQMSRADNLYGKLLAAGEALLELIRRFKGRSNKEIAAFTGQITALIDRFQ